MNEKRKQYDKAFKLEASKLVTEQGYSYSEVGRQLGIADWLVRGWVKSLRKSGDLPVAADGPASSSAEERKALRKENAKLRMENDILKKATAYFAKDIV
jgi:transposase